MAIDHHHEVKQNQHAQSCPSGHSAAPDNEDIGEEERHPNEVAEVEHLLDEETVDGCILADGCQQVGFHQHHRRLLCHEPHAKVENQYKGHDV